MSSNDDFTKIFKSDQNRESMKELAQLIHGYFTALVDTGFSRSEALELTKSWQSIMIPMAALGPKQD